MMDPASLVLGIDGGGSGGRALLVRADGRPLAWTRGEDPVTGRLPPDALVARVGALLTAVAGRAALPPGSAVRLVAGVAGAGRPQALQRVETACRRALEDARLSIVDLRVLTDAEIALAAAGEGTAQPAAVLLAGTGSMALARGPTGRVARAGGWGPYLGDEGGGFWFGRRVLEVAVRARDGRAPHADGLARAALGVLGLADCDALVQAAPALWADGVRMAALAPLVLERADGGDAAAAGLVAEAGVALAGILLGARQAAGVPPSAPTALAGGLWTAGPLRAALAGALPVAVAAGCAPLAIPPVVGAAGLGLEAAAAARLYAAVRRNGTAEETEGSASGDGT